MLVILTLIRAIKSLLGPFSPNLTIPDQTISRSGDKSPLFPYDICLASNFSRAVLTLPASILTQSGHGVSVLLLRRDAREIMARMLEKISLARESVKMGRSKGREAPTMPREDSTMGQ